MNEPYQILGHIPCERGTFEVREVYFHSQIVLQLLMTNGEGRPFSRYIFPEQIEPLARAIQLFLAKRAAEQPTTTQQDWNDDE